MKQYDFDYSGGVPGSIRADTVKETGEEFIFYRGDVVVKRFFKAALASAPVEKAQANPEVWRRAFRKYQDVYRTPNLHRT